VKENVKLALLVVIVSLNDLCLRAIGLKRESCRCRY
jgi:hypothetical protein